MLNAAEQKGVAIALDSFCYLRDVSEGNGTAPACLSPSAVMGVCMQLLIRCAALTAKTPPPQKKNVSTPFKRRNPDLYLQLQSGKW